MNEDVSITPPQSTRAQDRNRLSDMLDKYLFLGLFVLGVIGIVYMKRLGFSQVSVTAFPVMLMLVYILVVIVERRLLLREDRAADNIYYLGFLYTLTSLSVALYYFSTADSPTEEIISNFGIALTTTIFGMAARLLLQQWRTDTVEAEKEARLHLSGAVHEFKGELLQSIDEFKNFRTIAAQVLEESFKRNVENTEKSISTILNRHEESSAEIIKHNHEVFGEYQEHAKKMNRNSRQIVAATERMLNSIECVDVNPDIVTNKINSMFDGLDQKMQQMVRNYEIDEAIVKRLEDRFNDILKVADKLKDSMGKMSDTFVPITGIESKVAILTDALERYSSAVQKQDQLNSQQMKVVEKSTATMQEHLSTITNQQLAIVENAMQQITQDISAIKEMRKFAEDELKKSWTATSKVHSGLASLADTVTNGVSRLK